MTIAFQSTCHQDPIRTFLKRIESQGVVTGLPQLNTVLRQFQVNDNLFEQVPLQIVEEDRPPMIEIPEYKEKFHLS